VKETVAIQRPEESEEIDSAIETACSHTKVLMLYLGGNILSEGDLVPILFGCGVACHSLMLNLSSS